MPIIGFGAFVVALSLELCTPSGPSGAPKGVVLVTLAWIHVYNQCIGHQLGIKMDFANDNPNAKQVAERCFYNTIEQAPLFLLLLWMHAIFVDASVATSLGANYVFFRMLYPVFYSAFGYDGSFNITGEISTQPNYMVLLYFQVSLFMWACDYGSFYEVLMGLPGGILTRTVVFFVGALVNMIIGWKIPTGALCARMNNACNPAKVKA